MGRATRWLKGLFGFTKNNSKGDRNSDSQQDQNSCSIDSLRDKIPRCAPGKNFSGPGAAWLRANSSETEKDLQAKHAIAVAAATAVAADAAVAAARVAAAAAMVKLTHRDRQVAAFGRSGHDERWLAAVKIQTVFRGYLARKALRALRGLVKLQALVRGYLVRRQANAVLQSMQALMRAQATARSRRSQHCPLPEHRTSYRTRKSTDKFDWMGDKFIAPTHSRRLSATLDVGTVKTVHKNSKIVEVDSGRPKTRSHRTNASDFYYPSLSSPLPPSKIPVLVPDHDCSWNFREFGDECRCSSAQNTPQFSNSTGADKFFGEPFYRGHIPSYMASTQCFEAKLRSLSAPRQRPRSGDPERRLSVHEMMFSRSSLSGVGMQRSCGRAQEAIDFRNAVIR